MKTKSEKLREFVLEQIDGFEYSGSGGQFIEMPEYDLYAQDYLAFAEKDLISFQTANNDKDQADSLTNYISRLKQAMDCQLNMMLQVYNIERWFSKKKLGFDKKLDFLEKVGIFSPRSLRRLNTLRNKMEHQFQIPRIEKIEDLEIYYDMVSAFVSILQSAILSLYMSSEMDMDLFEEGKEVKDIIQDRKGFFCIK